MTSIERIKSLPAALPRSVSMISRFNEQFSSSSESSCLEHETTICGACPAHIVHLLKGERKERRLHMKHIQQKTIANIGKALARHKARRLSNPSALAYEQRRSLARETVDKYRTAKKARLCHEKEHKLKTKLTGSVWGSDPMAGRVTQSSTHNLHIHGCYIFKGARKNSSDEYGVEEIDLLGRRTGRQWLQGSKWGVECGGPGKTPQFKCPDVRQYETSGSATAELGRRRTPRQSFSPWLRAQSPAS